MSRNRTKTWLLAWGVPLLLAGTAVAQPETDYLHGVGDLQLFGPADLREYGSGPRPLGGWFGGIEGLHWTIQRPDRTTIGAEGFNPLAFDGQGFIVQPNSVDTGFIESDPVTGQRVEFGFVEDQRGWFFSGFKLKTLTSRIVASHAGVSFNSPFVNGISILEGFVDIEGFEEGTGRPIGPDGIDDDINRNNVFGRDGIDLGVPNDNPPPAFIPPLDRVPDVPAPTDFGDMVFFPVFFDKLYATNRTSVHSVELNRIFQSSPRRQGGVWELWTGVRYFRFRENFNVIALGRPLPLPDGADPAFQRFSGVLADSRWDTTAENNIVGPQLGVRGSWRRGRFRLNGEGRFLAGANFQSVRQLGTIADRARRNLGAPIDPDQATGNPSRVNNAPLNLFPTGFSHAFHATEFAPLVEMRWDLSYQVWRSVALNVGWTGMWMDGLARPANMIDYTLLDMGIIDNHNQQDAFIQGLTFGVEINR